MIEAGDIDIEKLIQEGEDKHHQLLKNAQLQVEMLKTDSFNFEIEPTNYFKFQEKDFKEEKKRV